MDELYMGTEEPQTDLKTEHGELYDEPAGQTETGSAVSSVVDIRNPKGGGRAANQSGTERRRSLRARSAPTLWGRWELRMLRKNTVRMLF